MTVELYSPIGANANSESSTALFKLGTTAEGQDGQKYVYVQANGSIALYDAVGVDEDFQAASLTTTTAAAMHMVAWAANHAFTNDYYGWVCRCGTNFLGNVKDNATADAPLYTTSVAGVIASDASTGNPVKIAGVTCVSVASGGGGSQLIASVPAYLME